MKEDSLGHRMKSAYENRTRYSLPRRTYTVLRFETTTSKAWLDAVLPRRAD